MVLYYSIHDKEGNTLTSDGTQYFVNETDFRAYMRKEMKRLAAAHYCEYREIGISRGSSKCKTIANF